MPDLTDYARRAAEYGYEARIDADTVDSYRALAYRDGILHLAERLQEPDVIEFGARAVHDEAPDAFTAWESETEAYRQFTRESVRASLAAMFAHITEAEK